MKHICLKTGTRILSGILSMSMMAGILSMPVMANETDTYKPVNDLKFTSNIKMNTETETEEDGSAATVKYEFLDCLLFLRSQNLSPLMKF